MFGQSQLYVSMSMLVLNPIPNTPHFWHPHNFGPSQAAAGRLSLRGCHDGLQPPQLEQCSGAAGHGTAGNGGGEWVHASWRRFLKGTPIGIHHFWIQIGILLLINNDYCILLLLITIILSRFFFDMYLFGALKSMIIYVYIRVYIYMHVLLVYVSIIRYKMI